MFERVIKSNSIGKITSLNSDNNTWDDFNALINNKIKPLTAASQIMKEHILMPGKTIIDIAELMQDMPHDFIKKIKFKQ